MNFDRAVGVAVELQTRLPWQEMAVRQRDREQRHPRATSATLAFGLFIAVNFSAPGQTSELLDPLTVVEERSAVPASETGFSVKRVTREMVQSAPQLRLDDLLVKQVVGFSLFRRNSSRVANPTTQGVSLRNIGPSGASRSLVLLDGIPLNDPFGGWVYWSRVPVEDVENVAITEGGGAGPWGNAALGGTIAIERRDLQEDKLYLSGTFGSRETYEVTAGGSKSVGKIQFFGRANHFETAGYPIVQPDQRGAVDVPADSRSESIGGGLRMQLAEGHSLTIEGSGFREDRGNGTPFTYNESEAVDASVSLEGVLRPGDVAYRLQGYAQFRDFRSTFSSVNADRSQETPSLDQFSVPARAAGGSFLVSLPITNAQNLLLGIDVRGVSGQTEERFSFQNGHFTRERIAGGDQFFAGIFGEHSWSPGPATKLTSGARLDYYENRSGKQTVRPIGGGVGQTDRFDAHDAFVPNGRLGLFHRIDERLDLRAAIYTGFRVPTLNELYRPFRVRNDITIANAALKEERLYGGELGLTCRPLAGVEIKLTGFYNELHDAVSNVTIGEGPADVPLFGFIPAGGTGRQRQNLDRVRVYGAELDLAWRWRDILEIDLSYLYAQAIVESAPSAPQLEGRRLAQTPEHQLVATVRVRPWRKLRVEAQVRAVGDQYEDDLNTLRLAPYAAIDASVVFALSDHAELFGAVENLANAEVETGKSADGLVNVGAPRLFTLGIRWEI
jgi:outer membrane receptor protein involved in Fe transport